MRTVSRCSSSAWHALVCVAVCAAIAATGGCRTAAPPETPVRPGTATVPPAPSLTEEVQRLTEQIEALETINQLGLDGKQVESIVAALGPAESARQQRLREKDSLRGQLKPLLEQQRSLLAKDEMVPEGLSGQIAKLQQDILRLDTIDPDVSAKVAAALRKTLTESQVLIAAGGLQAQIEATNALDGFRDLPKQAFEAEVGPYAQELASDSPDSSAQEVEALLRDAVSLGDREYEENKTKLVRQLQPFFAPAGQAADQLLTDAFSRPQMLEFLQERAASASSGAK